MKKYVQTPEVNKPKRGNMIDAQIYENLQKPTENQKTPYGHMPQG